MTLGDIFAVAGIVIILLALFGTLLGFIDWSDK